MKRFDHLFFDKKPTNLERFKFYTPMAFVIGLILAATIYVATTDKVAIWLDEDSQPDVDVFLYNPELVWEE